MHFAEFVVEHGKSDGQKDETNGYGKSFGAGMEESFAEGEQETDQRAERQRADNFDQRIDDNGNDVHAACAKRLCNAERNGEKHQTDCVVQSNDG